MEKKKKKPNPGLLGAKKAADARNTSGRRMFASKHQLTPPARGELPARMGAVLQQDGAEAHEVTHGGAAAHCWDRARAQEQPHGLAGLQFPFL